jgi:hypothetical protein
MDPKERIVGIDALAHPYFDGIRDQEYEDMVESRKAQYNQNGEREQSTQRSKSVVKSKSNLPKKTLQQWNNNTTN